tara:strand:- start:4108 stop:4782 length:675 start_codon:yes stop_codon:yes gene_type:complete
MKAASGDALFKTIQFSLICDKCLLTDNPEKCTHKLHELPRWLSASKIDVIKRMLCEDPAMYVRPHHTRHAAGRVNVSPVHGYRFLRETMGICAEATARAFREEKVIKFAERPRTTLLFNATHIYVSLDPAGGGNSAFSICSLLSTAEGGMQVACKPSQRSSVGRISPPHKSAISTTSCTNCKGSVIHRSTKSGTTHGSTLEQMYNVNVSAGSSCMKYTDTSCSM